MPKKGATMHDRYRSWSSAGSPVKTRFLRDHTRFSSAASRWWRSSRPSSSARVFEDPCRRHRATIPPCVVPNTALAFPVPLSWVSTSRMSVSAIPASREKVGHTAQHRGAGSVCLLLIWYASLRRSVNLIAHSLQKLINWARISNRPGRQYAAASVDMLTIIALVECRCDPRLQASPYDANQV